MIGTVFAEQNTVTGGLDPMKLEQDNKNSWDAARTKQELAKKYGDKANAVAAAFAKAYSEKKLTDAVYVDGRSRPASLAVAILKVKQGGAPVYNYLFTWQSATGEPKVLGPYRLPHSQFSTCLLPGPVQPR